MLRAEILASLVVAALSACAGGASAQQLFRYKDENGQWVYSDRVPTMGAAVEQLELDFAAQPAEVKVVQRRADGGVALVAENTFFSPVQIAYRLTEAVNMAESVRGNVVLAPRSETQLTVLHPVRSAETVTYKLSYEYIPGAPGAEHQDSFLYRVPYALATSYRVSQAYPAAITHSDPGNQFAYDFVMPIGTGVYAARGGTVIQIASNNFTSGLDPNTDLARANIVRILHDDGTMSLYGHLNWNSIRVRPGQKVVRGEYIADSGNTGFSTGPHLHFVVQRNVGGAIESVPIRFEGANGRAISVQTGDVVTAY